MDVHAAVVERLHGIVGEGRTERVAVIPKSALSFASAVRRVTLKTMRIATPCSMAETRQFLAFSRAPNLS